MNELLAHLVGDYFLQNDWMALGKYRHKGIALVHGLLYALPFLFITRDPLALLVIALTHSIIDHWKMANWITKLKNWEFGTVIKHYPFRPEYLTVWLGIITDNTMHLLINHGALWFTGGK